MTALGLSTFLESRADIAVLPSARTAEADVLVLAANPLDPELVARFRAVARDWPVRTVLVTRALTESELPAAAACRVVEVLPCSTTRDQLVAAVLAAAQSPPASAGRVETLRALAGRVGAAMELDGGLHSREIAVLRLVAEGLETAEIAHRLCYSERTVKNVLYTARRRLGLNNRQHTVAYALRAGVI